MLTAECELKKRNGTEMRPECACIISRLSVWLASVCRRDSFFVPLPAFSQHSRFCMCVCIVSLRYGRDYHACKACKPPQSL